jgi:hypothetical protein
MEWLAERDPEEARQLLDPVVARMMAAWIIGRDPVTRRAWHFDKVLLPVEGAAAPEGRLRYVSRQAPGRYGAMWEGRVEATTVMEPYSSRTCRRMRS